MSPNANATRGKTAVSSNIYTILLALALCVALTTAALVAYKCYYQYGTIFKLP